MNELSVVLAGAAAFAVLGPPAELTRLHRLRAQLPFRSDGDCADGEHRPPSEPTGLTSRRGRIWAAVAAAVGVAVIIQGIVGITVGAAAGAGSYFALGRVSAAQAQPGSAEHVALAAQLLASVLAAGCSPVLAAEIVGTALRGPLGDALVKCGTAARLGANATQTWSPLTGTPPWRAIGRAFSIAATRGTSPVPALQRAAEDARDEARWAGEARARSLGAKSAAPLGVCFLPAFILLAIVPVVVTSF